MLAVAIQAGMTVFDLEEMELAYSPQYGSAKDPINMRASWRAGCCGRASPAAPRPPPTADVRQVANPMDKTNPVNWCAFSQTL